MKAVIYDMDGVIVDSEPVHLGAWLHVFQKVGVKGLTLEYFYAYQGMSDLDICKLMVEKHHLHDDAKKLAEAKKYLYVKHMHEQGPTPIEDSLDVIEYTNQLRQQGIKTAIASSSPMQEIEFMTDSFHIRDKFDTLQTGDELPNSKPNPAIYLQTAAVLQVKPEDCVVIEDAENGVQAAKAAGMYCIGFRSPHTLNQNLSPADVIVDSMQEVKAAIAARLAR